MNDYEHGATVSDENEYLEYYVPAYGEMDAAGADEPGLAETFTFTDAGVYLETAPPPTVPILTGLFDAGDKVWTAGDSKGMKSWHAQQTLLHLAAGLPVFGLAPERPLRCVYVNFEIQARHLHRRFNRMGHALGITSTDLGGRLKIINARGAPPPLSVLRQPVDLICLDPWFKVLAALRRDENDPKDVGITLAEIDEHLRYGGAACWIVHHNPKGNSGDRNIIDRGAGSNKAVRDLDAMFSLGRHKDDPNAIVLEYLTRNYEPPAPVVIRFEGGCLIEDRNLEPVLATSFSEQQRRSRTSALDLAAIARQEGLLLKEPVRKTHLMNTIKSRHSLGERRAKDVVDILETQGFATWKTPTYPAYGMIGPEDMKPSKEKT